MGPKIILYDLPSRPPCKCWSFNPWKTRALLNYKAVPYETQWIEYPDIKPTFEKHMPPGNSRFPYAIPTVQFSDGSYMQDSKEIAKRIEKDYPTPTMHLNSECLAKLEDIMPNLLKTMIPDLAPKIPKRLLNEASLSYWYKTRELWFGGMSLDQVELELGGDTAWMDASEHIREVSKLLRENDSGPFFEGSQVTYVDFVWAGWVRCMDRLGDDMLQKLLECSGDKEVHLAHYKACDPWLTRDDH